MGRALQLESNYSSVCYISMAHVCRRITFIVLLYSGTSNEGYSE